MSARGWGRASLDTWLPIGPPTFSLVPAPGFQTVAAGSAAAFTVSVVPLGSSFDGEVTLACRALPPRASCTFSPAQVTPRTSRADSTLVIATNDANGGDGTMRPSRGRRAAPTTAAETYVLTVTGASDSLQERTVISLTVR